MAITTPNFLRGNTPAPGQPINTKSFGNLSDASTAARNAPRTDVFGIQCAGGFIAFPAAVVARASSANNIFALQPGSDVSTNSNPMYTITYGTWAGFVPTISGTALVTATASNVITLGPTDGAVYIEFDGTYDASGIITLVDAEILSCAAGMVPTPNVITGTGTGGDITVYQELFGVTITAPVGMGPYTVTAAPVVGGSQNINVCNPASANPSISGPFGV